MQPDRDQQDDRDSAVQDPLRALVRLLARTAAQEFVASSSTRSIQKDPADAHPLRSRP